MSIVLNIVTFVLGALFYNVGDGLICDYASYIWVALKYRLVPGAYPVEQVDTAESTKPRTSDSVHSTVTPISTPQLDGNLPRVSRPRKAHGKFSYVREREERERREREAKGVFRPLLPPILPAPLGRYSGGVNNGGAYVLRRSLVDVPSKLIQTTTFTP
ncbi:hypothetical protein FRC11_013164, partial [Ceratobasidium sp. 423]